MFLFQEETDQESGGPQRDVERGKQLQGEERRQGGACTWPAWPGRGVQDEQVIKCLAGDFQMKRYINHWIKKYVLKFIKQRQI